uniref:Secreted protein n=1 Tax=Achlya hypogyna TaxID=1202772 RepID=A0A0A7CNQ4_ACHHY|nr:secreted protein [Achlya hypogyna]
MRVLLATSALAAMATVADAWNMAPVRSIQARVQGDTPVWDETNKAYVSGYGATFTDKYTAVLDSVNLASVEGALKYVQSECINAPDLQLCQRKNKVKNIVFYDITIAQPNASLAQFMDNTAVYPEYGPFLAMDGGACTASGTSLPTECLQYNGLNGTVDLGPFVGGVPVTTDARALYPNTIWYSYPNSCVQQTWAKKTPACREAFKGGLCPFGTKPDGVKCTFSYTILGWISLDDLVGITSMKNPATDQKFANYSEFCNAKLTEFSATLLPNNSWADVKSDLKFWASPNDEAANVARAKAVVTSYGSTFKAPMVAIPTVCEVCSSPAADCVVKDASYKFPTLDRATLPPTTAPATSAPGTAGSSGSAKGNNNKVGSDASVVSGLSVIAAVAGLLTLAL